MKYDLIFSDFDGTLLKSDNTIDRKTADAIKDYISRGGHFVVCTGRMSSSIDPWLEYLGIGGQRIAVAGYQGTSISDTDGNLLYCDYIDVKTVLTILKKAKELNVYVHFYDDKWVYVAEKNWINEEYNRLTGAPLKPVGDLIEFLAVHPELKVIKIMIVVEPAKLVETLDECNRLNLNGVQFYTSTSMFVECVSSDGGKGNGLKKVAELLGIPLDKTLAIGDNMNDIPMLKAAGMSVAVGNALDAVKAEADYIAGTNDQNPIAEAIEKFCKE